MAQPPPSKGCNDVVWLESKSPPLSVQPLHLPFTKIPMVGLADIRGLAKARKCSQQFDLQAGLSSCPSHAITSVFPLPVPIKVQASPTLVTSFFHIINKHSSLLLHSLLLLPTLFGSTNQQTNTFTMESIKQAANYAAETVQGAVSGASKETNKQVAKDSNADVGTRYVYTVLHAC